MASLRIYIFKLDNEILNTQLFDKYELIENFFSSDDASFIHIGFKRPDSESIKRLLKKFPNRVICNNFTSDIFLELDVNITFSKRVICENLTVTFVGDLPKELEGPSSIVIDSDSNLKITSINDTKFKLLSVRAKNALGSEGILNVFDLAKYVKKNGQEKILKLPNIGQSTMFEILDCLDKDTKITPKKTKTDSNISPKKNKVNSEIELNYDSFNSFTESLKSFFDERQFSIISSRWGLKGDVMSLEEVGQTFKITRERVRQIEANAKNNLNSISNIAEFIDNKITSLRKKLNKPITFDLLLLHDEWFKGVRSVKHLRQILNIDSKNCKNKLEFLNGEYYLSHLGTISLEDSFNFIIDSIYENKTINKLDLEKIINRHIPISAFEFRTYLLDYIFTRYYRDTGDELLLLNSARSSNTNMVNRYIFESDIPIKIKDLLKIIQEDIPNFTIRKVETAVNNSDQTIYLFGPSTYGHKGHLNLSDSEIEQIALLAEEKARKININKQWSAIELFNLISSSISIDILKKIDKYKLAICIQLQNNLKYLGRNAFAFKDSNFSDLRIDKKEMIIDILKISPIPLTLSDIRERIKKVAAIPENFQIHDRGRIINIRKRTNEKNRLGEYKFKTYAALIDKHLSIDKKQHYFIVQEMASILQTIKSIKKSSLGNLIIDNSKLKNFYDDPEILVSLCERSVRFITDDQSIHLTKFYDKKPSSQLAALKMTAINIPDSGMHKDDIFNNAIKLFRSNINKGSFMQMLEEMEFVKHSDDDRFFWSDNFGY